MKALDPNFLTPKCSRQNTQFNDYQFTPPSAVIRNRDDNKSSTQQPMNIFLKMEKTRHTTNIEDNSSISSPYIFLITVGGVY